MLKGQTTVSKENLLQWIENYRWMVETIEEARQPVSKVDNNSYIGVKTAMYGIEAILPKASSVTSDPVFIEVQRRFYSCNKRIQEYEFKLLGAKAYSISTRRQEDWGAA